MKMKKFQIGNKDFTYPVEEGVIVSKLKGGMYHVHFSTWIAKTLMEWEHLINVDHIMKERLPFKYITKYLWCPNFHQRFNTPEGRILKMQSHKAFTDGVYFQLCEKYGTDKVRSSDHTYYNERGFEKKTEFINEKLNVFPYEELYMEGSDERPNS